MPDRLDRCGDVSLTSAQCQHVPAQDLHLREHWQLDEVTGDLPQPDAARERFIGQLPHGESVHGLALNEDIHDLGRHVQQAAILDLGHDRLHLLDQVFPAPRDRNDVAGLEHRVGIGLDQSVAAAHPLDEDPEARENLAHGLAGETAGGVDPVGTHLDLAIGGKNSGVAAIGRAAELLLVLRARSGRSTPISFGPSCASTMAEPIVPKM